jgi:uncharacterized protein YecT (DUF1311 family)
MQFKPWNFREALRAVPIALLAQLVLVLAAVLWAAPAAAGQAPAANPAQNAPDAPPPGPPPPATLQNPIPQEQLAFLNADAGQPAQLLLKDKRYKALMKQITPHTTYHYGRDMSLADALDMVMNGSTQPVSVLDGRYVLIAGANGPYLRGRGFVWFDLEAGTGLGVFYFQPTNGEPTPTLTVFSRQLIDTNLSAGQLPPAFAEALSRWSEAMRLPPITPRYFIPANGKKYVLLHDEQYCAAAPGSAAPPAEICEQLAEQAADDDMNSAYFMKETGNAANATAWMLGPDQLAWVHFRESTCGAGFACRIRVTRERTRVLTGRQIGESQHASWR